MIKRAKSKSKHINLAYFREACYYRVCVKSTGEIIRAYLFLGEVKFPDFTGQYCVSWKTRSFNEKLPRREINITDKLITRWKYSLISCLLLKGDILLTKLTIHITGIARCTIDVFRGGLIIRFKVDRDVARINDPTNLRRRSVAVLKRQRSRFDLRNSIKGDTCDTTPIYSAKIAGINWTDSHSVKSRGNC